MALQKGNRKEVSESEEKTTHVVQDVVDKKEEKKETSNYIAKELKPTAKYPIEAENDIFCEKDRYVEVKIKKPNVKETIFIVCANPTLEAVGIDHKEVINLEGTDNIKLRMTSVASSLSYKIAKGTKLFDLVPIA